MHLYLFARVGTSYSRKHADENIALENRENRFIGAFSASVPFTNTMYAGLSEQAIDFIVMLKKGSWSSK